MAFDFTLAPFHGRNRLHPWPQLILLTLTLDLGFKKKRK